MGRVWPGDQLRSRVFSFLKFTIELEEDFEEGYLPTLDIQIRVLEDGTTTYKYFEKPTNSNVMIQRRAALGESSKVSTLVQEIIRRMVNTSELESQTVRNEIQGVS